MTYKVSSETLNLCSLTHSLTHSIVVWFRYLSGHCLVMLPAGIVLAVCVRVCEGVCLCVCSTESQKLPIRNQCNLVGICLLVNTRRIRSWYRLTLTSDLQSYFSIEAITFEWLNLASSFSVWKYSFKYLDHL